MLSLAQTIKDLKNNISNIFNTMAPKTYVDKKVADLVNGAPAQLDTLQELSKALNNDKDFGATVNNAIAKKLDSAGGTITGNLTVNGTLTAKASTAGTADRALKADTCTGNAATASSVPWSGVTNKPTTFTPSAHNHAWDNITGAPATATRWPTWDEITGKPSSKNIIKNGTPTKDISLRYETENGKNVVAPYVDGVKVPLSLQDAANNGFEEVDFDSRILTFKPILQYSDMPSWNGGVTDNGFVEATGEIQIAYAEHSGTQVNYNSKHGTIPLGKIPLIDIDKAATISGGYQSETTGNGPEVRNRLIEATQSYIREHLDDFKAKAFNAIPESSNAIEFKIIPPDDVPIGSFHGGSQGGGR